MHRITVSKVPNLNIRGRFAFEVRKKRRFLENFDMLPFSGQSIERCSCDWYHVLGTLWEITKIQPFFEVETTYSFLLAELLLCYLPGNIFGVEISYRPHADDVRTMCRWRENEILGEISLEDDICRLHIVIMGWQQLCIKSTSLRVSLLSKINWLNLETRQNASLAAWLCILLSRFTL